VLGRDAVADRAGLFHRAGVDQRATAFQAGADHGLARHGGQQALDLGAHAVEVGGVRAQQDALRQLVVLGLAEQVHRHPVGRVLPSASTRISLGPAIMSMPTWPNTRRLALAT
jgi:hypothetical protein